MSRPPASPRRWGGTAVVGALLALSTVACSDDDTPDADPSADAATSSSGATTAAPLETVASLGTVTGRLSADRRARLLDRVTTTVDEWIDGAFPGGPVAAPDGVDPRAAFSAFTRRAAQRADGDAALMSNADLPAGVTSVALVNRRLVLDVLAVDGRPAGATARVTVGMVLSGAVERQERVTGSLFLTYTDGWHVFGYDMDRGEV